MFANIIHSFKNSKVSSGDFGKVRCTTLTQRSLQVYKSVSTDNIARNFAKLVTYTVCYSNHWNTTSIHQSCCSILLIFLQEEVNTKSFRLLSRNSLCNFFPLMVNMVTKIEIRYGPPIYLVVVSIL